MRLWHEELPPSRTVLVIVAAIGLWAALSLSRTFTSWSYLAWALPAMIVGATFAITYGRRSLGIAALLLGLVELLTLPALFARDETLYLLPTATSLRTATSLFSEGVNGVLREAAPVPAEPRFLIVIWTVSLVLGFLCASWIVVARPLGAVVTSLAVVAFAGSVGQGDRHTLYAAGAVVLTAVFFLADGRHRISHWTRRPKRVRPVHLGIPTVAVATLVALAAPAVLGAATPLFTLEGALNPRLVIIKPLSDVQRQLQVEPPLEVMRVRAERPAYWRLTGLDTYTGDEWVLEAKPVPQGSEPIPPPEPPTVGEFLVQEYEITSLLAPWLPAAFAAHDVRAPVDYEVDAASTTLLLRDETEPGLTYTVTSRLPSDEGLAVGPAPGVEGTENTEYFGDLARGILGDPAPAEPLAQAVAIEEHFRGYTYDEDVPGGHTVGRLQAFLDERRGYCEQFAATMTLMLRGLGIPARVAVGFLPGRRSGDRGFVVTTREAHAWVEAHIPGAGWIPFDPTPGRGTPRGEVSQQQEEIPTPQPETQLPQPEPTPPAELTPPPITAPPTGGGGSFPMGPVMFAVLGTVVVGAVPGAKAVRRELRRSGSGSDPVAAAYDELLERAADLGFRPSGSETEQEFHRRVFASVPDPGPAAASNVVTGAILARYAPVPLTKQHADVVWRSVTAAAAALRRTVSLPRRVAAIWDPRTLIPADLLARTSRELTEGLGRRTGPAARRA